VEIDHGGAEFPYRQLAAHLRERITSGEYPAGRKLPSIIELQGESGLSAKTVQRAIAVLAAEGLVVTVPNRGTFVTNQ
jgi:GntR family transcriptional regulator